MEKLLFQSETGLPTGGDFHWQKTYLASTPAWVEALSYTYRVSDWQSDASGGKEPGRVPGSKASYRFPKAVVVHSLSIHCGRGDGNEGRYSLCPLRWPSPGSLPGDTAEMQEVEPWGRRRPPAEQPGRSGKQGPPVFPSRDSKHVWPASFTLERKWEGQVVSPFHPELETMPRKANSQPHCPTHGVKRVLCTLSFPVESAGVLTRV